MNSICDLAERLAAFANTVGGGHPLITVLGSGAETTVLWQYGKQDIILRCTGVESVLPSNLIPEEPLELNAPTFAAAFDLIRETERRRQPTTDYPYLRFGPMPGTTLDAKHLTHDI